MLSNRVHPRGKNDKIQAFRPVLHNTIMQTLLEAERAIPPVAVEAAPEVQEEEYVGKLRPRPDSVDRSGDAG